MRSHLVIFETVTNSTDILCCVAGVCTGVCKLGVPLSGTSVGVGVLRVGRVFGMTLVFLCTGFIFFALLDYAQQNSEGRNENGTVYTSVVTLNGGWVGAGVVWVSLGSTGVCEMRTVKMAVTRMCWKDMRH